MTEFLMKSLFPVVLVTGACPALAQSASEERPVASFSRLDVQDGIDVYLTQATQGGLRVEVDGYALEDVVTEVEGSELRLYRDGPRQGGFFPEVSPIRVYLDFVQLSAIEASAGSDIQGRGALEFGELAVLASGGSDVALDDVQAASLEFRLSGGSDLRIRGRAPSLTVEASGGSDVSATSLEAERVALRLSGGSDASVRASAAIEIDAQGGSDVEVRGDPTERRVDNDRSSDVEWR